MPMYAVTGCHRQPSEATVEFARIREFWPKIWNHGQDRSSMLCWRASPPRGVKKTRGTRKFWNCTNITLYLRNGISNPCFKIIVYL